MSRLTRPARHLLRAVSPATATNKASSAGFHDAGSDGGPAAASSSRQQVDFGLLFDIDGVIVRGKKVLPFAPNAFRMLVDGRGKFVVPTVFVTNAGNRLRSSKAEQLSDWLGIEITEDQVVMSHSPLKMYKEYHDKHVLVVGQGPIYDIATNLGFQKVTTMKTFRHLFPSLDAVDHKRRRAAPCAFEDYFPRVEAIVLFGEPIRWETSLQLLVDALVTNGKPSVAPQTFNYPHIPVLACNMDLQWMAEAVMPRFGHGAFLLSLENLYKKITGYDLIYTALVGKPSEITYRHGEHVLQLEAKRMGLTQPVKTIYCIGDNVCTDIFGANLYNSHLQMRRSQGLNRERRRREQAAGNSPSTFTVGGATSRSIDHLITGAEYDLEAAEHCYSMLVETGVFSSDSKECVRLDHSPRDFLPADSRFQEPTYTVQNVLAAVELIFRKQNFP